MKDFCTYRLHVDMNRQLKGEEIQWEFIDFLQA